MAERIAFLLLLALFLCCPVAASAAEIRVPADQPTIQDGMDAAQSGDTVVIASGTYTGPDNRDLDFKGKAITVRSENGAEDCIINCQWEGFGFILRSAEGQRSVLEGLTIHRAKNLEYGGGGGVVCDGASPTLSNNIFDACEGMEYGAILCLNGSSPVIEHNIFRNSYGWTHGGIACVNGSSPLIIDNEITSSQVRDGAAALYIGGQSSPMVINNLFHGNKTTHGSVIGVRYDSAPTLINNTITGTVVPGGQCYGVISVGSGCTPVLVNCIAWNRYVTSIDDRYGDPVVRYCDFRYEEPMGPGCIDTNPLFVSGPEGDFYLSQVAAGQDADSPCLDAGDPGTSSPGGTTRTDGGPDSGVPDMGYHYESFAAVCDLDGSGRVDGIDLSIIGAAFGAGEGDPRYNGSADFDRSGVIDGDDLVIFSFYFGATV